MIMKDFQIYPKKNMKLSLHKYENPNVKMKYLPTGLKSIFITNGNGLEISSQYGNYYNSSKKNMLSDNINNHITYNNIINNKNLSFPMNAGVINNNINRPKFKESPLMDQKKNLFKNKFEKYLNYSKNEKNLNNYN